MDEERSTRLPPTAWAVLGLLSFPGERSGYELKKWADNSLRFFYWSPAISQIYGELRRLEQLGYVTSRPAPQDELRKKRLYRITDAGLAALTDWARTTPPGPPVLKHGVALRVWLGHLSDPEELSKLVTEHLDDTQSRLDEIRYSLRRADETQSWPYPEIVLRWGERYYQAERDLAEQMLADIDELATRQSDQRDR
jgi:DNA-binding PadR family transcriptional regulator